MNRKENQMMVSKREPNSINRIINYLRIRLFDKQCSNEENHSMFHHLSNKQKLALLKKMNPTNRERIFNECSFFEKEEIIEQAKEDEKSIFINYTKDLDDRMLLISKVSSAKIALRCLYEYPEGTSRDTLIRNLLHLFRDGVIKIEDIKDERLLTDIIIASKQTAGYSDLLVYDDALIKDPVNQARIAQVTSKKWDYLRANSEILDEMEKSNKGIRRTINVALLSERYISTLGIDKINVIGCDKEYQEKLLHLNENEYRVFCTMLDFYQSYYKTEDWKTIVADLLDKMNSGYFKQLLTNVNEKDLEDENFLKNLGRTLQIKGNPFDIKKAEDVSKLDDILFEQKAIEGLGISDIGNIACEKFFGISLFQAENIIDAYSTDIEYIHNQDLQDFVTAIKLIVDLSLKRNDQDINEKNRTKILELIDRVQEFDHRDFISVEQALKDEYAQLYDEVLFKTTDLEKLGEIKEGYYEAGTEFKMLVTIKGGANIEDPTIDENYKKDWNRPSLRSPSISASFISEEMLCTISPYIDVCYGFSELNNGDLTASSYEDIASHFGSENTFGSSLKTTAKRPSIYLSPQHQIDKTHDYNQMNVNRYLSNGEKRQPDYIVAFMVDDKIINEDKIEQARKDWDGEIPVIVVNVNQCLREQEIQINKMISQYRIQPSEELRKRIQKKISNNRLTLSQFHTEKFDFNKEEWDEKAWIDIEMEEKSTKTKIRQTKMIRDIESVMEI